MFKVLNNSNHQHFFHYPACVNVKICDNSWGCCQTTLDQSGFGTCEVRSSIQYSVFNLNETFNYSPELYCGYGYVKLASSSGAAQTCLVYLVEGEWEAFWNFNIYSGVNWIDDFGVYCLD